MWDKGKNILCARGWVQRFSFVSPEIEKFSLDLPQAVKKGCALEVRSGMCVEFAVAGKKKILTL